tara:strand:- start:42447 stop:43055 length:609 start_codon:yes stop_codon:yes gene_type:complete
MTEVEVSAPNINITEAAKTHFSYLIEKEEVSGMNLRVFLDQPGLPTADIGICFCPQGEERTTDFHIEMEKFILFIDRASAGYLEDAKIDYVTDKLGGSLSVTAPNLKGPKPEGDTDLSTRIEYILQTEVNPNLASHGGMVSLVEITKDIVVVLRFGGGCQGCGMADVTLKEGIEKSLKQHFPEITAVRDVTDHAEGENPYYR